MARDDDDSGEATPREHYPGGDHDAISDETQPGEDEAMREQQEAGAGDRPPGVT